MLENFIYSVNVTFPIFLVMVLGWFLRQRGMFNENFINIANKFNFTVTLPFMVFRDISAVDIRKVFDAAVRQSWDWRLFQICMVRPRWDL